MGCGTGAGVELSKYDKYVQTFEISVNREILQYAPSLYKPLIKKAIFELIYQAAPREKADLMNAMDDKTYQEVFNKITEYLIILRERFNPNYFKLLLELQRLHETYLALVPADKREVISLKIMEKMKDVFAKGAPELSKYDEKQLAEYIKILSVKNSIEELKKDFPF